MPSPNGKVFDENSAAEYVRDLFVFVLDRKKIDATEFQYWTRYLLERQDAAEVLALFARSGENRRRRALLAESGAGYPPGHFYSPIVDLREIEECQDKVFARDTLAGINLNLSEQAKTFDRLVPHLKTLPFAEVADGKHRYYYNNTSYGYGDAFIYWAMIAEFRPKKIIEVGSGFTSALALDAIDFHKLGTTCVFIDPHPELLEQVAAPIGSNHTIIDDRVQKVDPTIVDTLQRHDFLFIDSSHVVKTGSDVQYELFEFLPRLKPGVIVHFHDVFSSFEYPRAWIFEQRLSWNEQYFLRAFLMYNNAFEILYFNHCFAMLSAEALGQLPLEVRDRVRLNPGGGLWLRRV